MNGDCVGPRDAMPLLSKQTAVDIIQNQTLFEGNTLVAGFYSDFPAERLFEQ